MTVFESRDPLIASFLEPMRDRESCDRTNFTLCVDEIGVRLFEWALSMAENQKLPPYPVQLLRAGEGMLRSIYPSKVDVKGSIGVMRDEETLIPQITYKAVDDQTGLMTVVCDVMLATGASMSDSITLLKQEFGATKLIVLSIITCPEGISRMQADHPDVDIFVAVVDSHLDERGYIVRGCGDAGDRQFGKKKK
jgi:uracil phosphoribosyltransferase